MAKMFVDIQNSQPFNNFTQLSTLLLPSPITTGSPTEGSVKPCDLWQVTPYANMSLSLYSIYSMVNSLI